MATAARPPHSFSPSYVPRSRPASPALPPIPTASTSNGPSRPTPTPRPRSTPGSPLVNAHSAPQSSPLVNAPPRSSPVTHPIPTKPRSPALTPRLGDRSERRGSGLKHELRNGERSAKKLAKVDQAVEEGTNAILKVSDPALSRADVPDPRWSTRPPPRDPPTHLPPHAKHHSQSHTVICRLGQIVQTPSIVVRRQPTLVLWLCELLPSCRPRSWPVLALN